MKEEFEQRFLTVKEFAERAGVSCQTIYQQVKNGRLAEYSTLTDGKMLIQESALKLYTPKKRSNKGKNKGSGKSANSQLDSQHISQLENQLERELVLLNERIQDKEREIERQAKQIADLSETLQKTIESLQASQKMQMIYYQKLEQIEQKTTEQEQAEGQTENQPETDNLQSTNENTGIQVDKLTTGETKNSGFKGFFRRLFS